MPVNLGATLTSFISRAIRIVRGENRQAVDQEPSPISLADPQEQTAIDPGILLRCLEIEWQDHFQTRQQTWRTLEIVVSLVVAMIGVDWQLQDQRATALAAFLVINAAMMGVLITRRHRNVEIAKFTSIIDIERKLGLQAAGLFVTVKPPVAIEWIDIIKPLRQSTPLFIMRMHVALMSVGVVYLVFRLLTPFK